MSLPGFLSRRRALVLAIGGGALVVAAGGSGCVRARPFPSENTPEGAYARIVVAVSEGRIRDVFAYLEDEAQWAAHTIQKQRAAALSLAKGSFPKDDYDALVRLTGEDASASDGVDVFVHLAKAHGWIARIRKDLSGVARVERGASSPWGGGDGTGSGTEGGDRATLVTARGTRYSMKRRPVGIWGLTMFTAELVAEAEKATRDRARIEEAARDFAALPTGAVHAP